MEEYRIKQIIEKLLKSQYKKNVFLILDKSDIYIDEVYKIINKFEYVKFEYIESDLSLDYKKLDKIRSVGEKLNHKEDIENSIENADLVIIPFLTKNTLAKVSLGIVDDVISYYIQLAIMMNKNIVALDILSNPNTEYSKIKKINLNTAYNNMLLNYYSTLESFGVKILHIYELEKNINGNLYERHNIISNIKENIEEVIDKKYLTMKDIEGKEIVHISKNSKFTDLAKEYILEKNINVVKK